MKPILKRGRCVVVSSWLLLLTGCVSQPVAAPGGLEAAVPLTNTYWQLEEVAGEAVAASGAASEAHLILRDDGRINGFSGCNAFQGEYQLIDGRRLVFSRIASTRRACADADSPEAAFFDALANTAGVRMEDRRLWLMTTDGEALAEFEATRQP